jgi:hypothetical protein
VQKKIIQFRKNLWLICEKRQQSIKSEKETIIAKENPISFLKRRIA